MNASVELKLKKIFEQKNHRLASKACMQFVDQFLLEQKARCDSAGVGGYNDMFNQFVLRTFIFEFHALRHSLIVFESSVNSYIAEAKKHVSEKNLSRSVDLPKFGTFVLCVAVPANRQEQFLADFEEVFTKVWLPRFGPRVARWVYIAQALRSAVGIIGVGVMGAAVDRMWRMIRLGG